MDYCMSKSLYAQYVEEREKAQVLEKDWGFAIYKLLDNHVYLQDIYVVPHERKNGKGVELMHEVADIASKAGLNIMVGSVVPSTSFGAQMLRIMLGLGFELLSSSENIVYLKRNI